MTEKYAQFDQAHWLDLRRLSVYASISVRELRDLIKNPVNPLPAYQMGKKLFVNKDEYDTWFRSTARRVVPVDVDRLVSEICSSVGAG